MAEDIWVHIIGWRYLSTYYFVQVWVESFSGMSMASALARKPLRISNAHLYYFVQDTCILSMTFFRKADFCFFLLFFFFIFSMRIRWILKFIYCGWPMFICAQDSFSSNETSSFFFSFDRKLYYTIVKR